MRYALILILLAVGCPNPQQARGDDAPAAKPQETYAEAVARNEALLVKVAAEAKARDEEAAKVAAERDVKVHDSLKGVSETVGNTNSELSAIAEQLRATNTTLKTFADEWRSWRDAEREPSFSIPPIHIDAPPPVDADKKTVSIDGKSVDLEAYIKKWYRPNRGFHDPDDGQVLSEHLVAHGVAAEDVAGMNYATQHVLHIAIHLQEKAEGTPPPKAAPKVAVATPKFKAKSTTVYRGTVQNCPNGQCPLQRQATVYFKGRRR